MDNCIKKERIANSITLSNRLNITHDEIITTILSLDDKKNFIPYIVTLANNKEKTVYEMTAEGIEKIEKLYEF
jgi:hypothetical protein